MCEKSAARKRDMPAMSGVLSTDGIIKNRVMAFSAGGVIWLQNGRLLLRKTSPQLQGGKHRDCRATYSSTPRSWVAAAD